LDRLSCAAAVEMLGGGGEQTLTLCDTVRRTGVAIVDEKDCQPFGVLDATDAKWSRNTKVVRRQRGTP